ncbi:MAG: hypothetical protein IT359_20505 [Gemmatimonadaceae bacterium]|nr:hypothetical protein [Gemmatimonadaceae bacterium]
MQVTIVGAVPPGYVRLDLPQGIAVVHHKVAESTRAALAAGTLYAWAAAHPDRRQMQGRLPVYAAPLPDGAPTVVVRHARHGGMLAPVLRDLFLPPTRAPRELRTALILAQLGVPTPPVAGYAVYRAGPILRRADVMTLLLPGEDLGAMLRASASDADRERLVTPVAALLGALTQAGAWHPDLNVKNILLVPDDAGELHPAVLDVDRVRFVPPGDPNVREANFRRLEQSLDKWRALHGAGFTSDQRRAIHERLLQDEAVEATHRALALDAHMPTDLT